ncbi:MAG: acyltransferase family protein [Mycobacteriales bacterium]
MTEVTPPGPPAAKHAPRIRGLDGVRALAILTVFGFHAGLPGLGGGFLGVEIFFVLSGFLITGLLVDERCHTGRIRLKAFWARRARRLLPAVYLMIPLVLLGFALALPGEVAQVRSDALAGLGYVTNWWLIVRHQSYFQTFGRPSPFTHLWSLAIEEQFYLLWPLVLVLALPRVRRHLLAAIAALLAATSACLMGLLFVPGTDPSVVYYSSETRASGLLFGAAAALATWPMLTGQTGRSPSQWPASQAVAVQSLGWLSFAGLVACCVRFGEESTSLYRGGFSLVDALSVGLIYVLIAQPRGPLTRVLDHPILRWLGLRSYGIYVWHWPIFVVTRPGADIPGGVWPSLMIRICATGLVAEASYRYLEMPIRGGALSRWWGEFRKFGASRAQRAAITAAAAVSVLVAGTATAVAVAMAKPAPPPVYLARLRPVHTALATPTVQPMLLPQLRLGANRFSLGPTQGASHPAPGAVAPDGTRTPSCSVSAVGDSVLLGALPALRRDLPQLRAVDAQVGMQVQQAIALLRQRASAHQLGCAVIVEIGNNGPLTLQDLADIMAIIGPKRRAIFVNVHVPRPWGGPNDRLLSEVTRRWDNTVLVNWARYAAGHQHLFYPDDTHLDPLGQIAYARLIAAALQRSLV